MAGALPKVDDKLLLDMHVHVGPEYLQRRYSAQALMDEGRREGFGAVMKNHFQPTTAWVSQAVRPDDKVRFAGAIVLNAAVGGVDDQGIRSAMSGWKRDVRAPDPERGGAVVWMPTLSSEAHLNLYGRREMPEAWGVKGQYSRLVPIGCGYRLDEKDARLMAALDRMLAALAEFIVLGLPTNVEFLARVLGSAAFRAGHVDTAYLDTEGSGLVAPTPLPPAVLAAAVVHEEAPRIRPGAPHAVERPDPWTSLLGWRG